MRVIPRWKAPLLATWTIVYLAWSLIPITLLIRVSLADSSGLLNPRGFSLFWYREAMARSDLRSALFLSLVLAGATIVITVPLGVALGVGLASWNSRRSAALRPVAVAPLVVPQIVLAAGFFFAFLHPLGVIGFGRDAQLIAHITIALPFVVLLVWARLFSIGPELEEMAMDLGASRATAFVRVTVPLLLPAIVAGMAVSFVVSFDNLVVSQLLCLQDCRTLPMLLYGRGRAVVVSPAVIALGTISMLATLVAMAIGFSAWKLGRRWSQRPEVGASDSRG